MFNLKELKKAVEQVAQEKGVDSAKVFEALEMSLAAAYKKEYCQRGEVVRCQFDQKTGALKFWKVKTVVDLTTVRVVEEEEDTPAVAESEAVTALRRAEKKEEMAFAESRAGLGGGQVRLGGGADEEDLLPRYNSERHIMVEEAKQIKPDAQLAEELTFPLETHEDFGRIAAQTAKQVILQKLREAERNSILDEFKNKEGEILSGVVQRYDRGNVYIDLGRATGILFYNESIPGEHYSVGDRLRFYILAVQEEAKIPGIILSRSHPKFISRLFELEVPEIADGIVEIKSIAREPGSRTKISVASKSEGIDPVGSCVGQRGTRVMAVSNELGQEKIDIIEWSDDPAKFIANSLSPAKVSRVEISSRREAKAFVPDDQLSLAIGKGGQNVRLAAKLTSWKIDVRSQANPDEVLEGGVAVASEGEAAAPTLAEGEVGAPTSKSVGAEAEKPAVVDSPKKENSDSKEKTDDKPKKRGRKKKEENS